MTSDMNVCLLSWTTNPAYTIETGAAVCYDSKPSSKVGRIMKKCYEHGHESVLEHAAFTFSITGVSRALLAQITRHRLASFSVRSQRYCREDGFHYVIPPTIEKNEATLEFYKNAIHDIQIAYEGLLAVGVPEEDARYLLPNACETQIIMTVNFRELIHICNERLCSKAQWEIRNVVRQMADEVIRIFPEADGMLVPKCERYKIAFCMEKDGCGRHEKLNTISK